MEGRVALSRKLGELGAEGREKEESEDTGKSERRRGWGRTQLEQGPQGRRKPPEGPQGLRGAPAKQQEWRHLETRREGERGAGCVGGLASPPRERTV